LEVMPDQAAIAAMGTKPSHAEAVIFAPARDEPSPHSLSLLTQTLDVAESAGPLVVSRALGSRLFDAHGHSYIDLCMGHGALLMGHGAAAIKDALHNQVEAGWLFGFSHDIGKRVADLIHAAGPANERVMLCNSESDATLLALRAARAHTARDMIAVFSGATHGLHDSALITAQFEQAPAANDATLHRKVHVGAGIPKATDESVMRCPLPATRRLTLSISIATDWPP
jgi:glutamate-1-semialdehyde aminotransferase